LGFSRGSPLDDPPQTQRFVVALAVGTHLVAQVDALVRERHWIISSDKKSGCRIL
jgi:hypothetical protein